MCRSTDYPGFQAKREALKIQAFFLRFKGLDSRKPLPESLTLSYLPRINGTALEVGGSKIRPDSAAFVTLHRAVNAKVRKGEAIFGSREAVRAGDGVRFEAYLREEKMLKGIFRKDEGQDWKLECKCVLESESVGAEITEAEVCVAVEGHVAMSERVKMVVKRRGKCGFHPLEEIPEVDEESDGECFCICGEMDGGDLEEDGDVEEELEMDVEGVRWAVDVGFWVMCLGVGYLVSKASSKSLRRRRLF
ncbi:PREDICTED: uncharacterized protein LOC101293650 [Fragaria vesca subsp. vesca]|uniref:uncharacterized protein LOC101293650 n=1 Tax=Fragaria vesca subsp. vesca TaxID=101020 RepID=UPI0002C35613|nr:PREDICTED: uncharacterized protein LOC101293650 [Fragaria vesca subsp. vesca]